MDKSAYMTTGQQNTFKSILNTKTSLIQTCNLLLNSDLGLSNELKKLLTTIIIRENLYHYTCRYLIYGRPNDRQVLLPDGTEINQHTPATLEYAASIIDQFDISARSHILLQTPHLYTDINGKHMRRFHVPIKLSDVLTDKRKMYLDGLFGDLYSSSNRTNSSQISTISDLHEKLVDGIHTLHHENLDIFELKYVSDKKHQNRKTLLASPDTKFSNRFCLQRPLRELLGRLRTTLIPSMHAEARIIGKIGLLQYVDEETWNRDPDTAAVVLCMVAEASDARAFTLKSAERGSFSEAIHLLLQYLGRQPNTNWGLLACIHPTHIKDSSGEHIDWIFRTCLKLLRQFSYVLNYLWNSGVKECATKNMLIPKRSRISSGINSSAWNAIADAWNNLLRFIRNVNHVLLKPQIPVYKTMRLMAGDLTQWANVKLKCLEDMSDRPSILQEEYLHLKSNKADADVFAELAADGLTPWSCISATRYSDIADFYYGEQSSDLFKSIEAACKKHDFPVNRYLGTANAIMKSEFRTHKTMICGIEIIPADWTEFNVAASLIESNVGAKSNPAQSEVVPDKIPVDKSDPTNVDIYGNQLDPSHTDCNIHKHSHSLDPTIIRTIINTLKSLGFAGAKSWTGK